MRSNRSLRLLGQPKAAFLSAPVRGVRDLEMSLSTARDRRKLVPLYAKPFVLLGLIPAFAHVLSFYLFHYATHMAVAGKISGFSYEGYGIAYFTISAVAIFYIFSSISLLLGLFKFFYGHIAVLLVVEATSLYLPLKNELAFFIFWQIIVLPQLIGVISAHRKWLQPTQQQAANL